MTYAFFLLLIFTLVDTCPDCTAQSTPESLSLTARAKSSGQKLRLPNESKCRRGRRGSLDIPCLSGGHTPRPHRLKEDIDIGHLQKLDLKNDSASVLPEALLHQQVFKLQKVYLSSDGEAFNLTHFFLRHGCKYAPLDRIYWKDETRAHNLNRVVNMIYRPQLTFFHGLIEWMPIFLLLAPLLRENPDLPLIASQRQWQFYKHVIAPLTGVPLSYIPHITIPTVRTSSKHPTIYSTEEVFHSVYQQCGNPSRRLWKELRKSLLHPDGIPFFTNNWKRRQSADVMSKELAQTSARDLRKDWVVVLGKRNTHRRSIIQFPDIERLVRKEFPPDRVVIFDGSLPILKARALFRKALLYVAAHGAGLSNAIFMPENASLLEIRPNQFDNPCYTHLAKACGVNLFLMFGRGDHSSQLDVNVTAFARLLKKAKQQVSFRVDE